MMTNCPGERFWPGLAGLISAGIGLSLLVQVSISPDRGTCFIAYNILILVSLVGAWATAVWFRHSPLPDQNLKNRISAGLVGFILCPFLIWIFGHRQFGGFDHSALIDLAWRQFSGQLPTVDFPSTLPLGFVLGAGWAFKLFGPSWSALIIWQALFSALTFLWSYLCLLSLTKRAGLALLAAFSIQACANLVTSYWWYNSATTTFAALFFLSALLFWKNLESRAAGISYVLSLTLLASMKPNIAGVLIAGVSFSFFLSPKYRSRALLYSILGFVLFLAGLQVVGVGLGAMLSSYLSIAGRGFTLGQFLQDLSPAEKVMALVLLMALFLPWFLTVRRFLEKRDPVQTGLILSALAAGLYGFMTNGENKLVDLPLLFLALSVGGDKNLGEVEPKRNFAWSIQWNSYAAGLMMFILVQGLGNAALRLRVQAIGYGSFFEYGQLDTGMLTPFFKDMRAGPRLIEVESEVERALHEEPSESVFFGPRMQWAYAAFYCPSPTGQPVWWHPGVSYPSSAEDQMVQAWERSQFGLLVFLKDDFTYLPATMIQKIQRDYSQVPGFSELTVFTRVR